MVMVVVNHFHIALLHALMNGNHFLILIQSSGKTLDLFLEELMYRVLMMVLELLIGIQCH